MLALFDKIWDVAVIGGGPAGMMAAGRAAELGASVVLLEKNPGVGKKLLITGGGRCNVTNAEVDTKRLLAKYKDGGRFLASPFTTWSSQNTIAFFEERGMPIKIEKELRAFPTSNSARSVHETLLAYLRAHDVTVVTNLAVRSLEQMGAEITGAQTDKGTVRARTFILATGGISRPDTGSTGDGFRMLRTLGYTVDESGGALVPLALKPSPLTRAAGVSLLDARISVFQDDEKQLEHRGKMLITHVGLSGPAVLNASRTIGELLMHGPVFIEMDFLPDQGYEHVDAQLQEMLKVNTNKKVRNAFGTLIAPALVSPLLDIADIDAEKMSNGVTRDERIRLMKTLKHLRVEVDHLLGLEKAVVTSGGLALTEIDFKTMRSAKHKNLFVTGDILNIDRPSGGYSLQLCWATGFVAGSGAAAMRA